jgi:hypothetical protein
MPNYVKKDTLKKRVRWSSKPIFSQEHMVDKYRSQKDSIQLQKTKNYHSANGMHLNPNNHAIEAHKRPITRVCVI